MKIDIQKVNTLLKWFGLKLRIELTEARHFMLSISYF